MGQGHGPGVCRDGAFITVLRDGPSAPPAPKKLLFVFPRWAPRCRPTRNTGGTPAPGSLRLARFKQRVDGHGEGLLGDRGARVVSRRVPDTCGTSAAGRGARCRGSGGGGRPTLAMPVAHSTFSGGREADAKQTPSPGRHAKRRHAKRRHAVRTTPNAEAPGPSKTSPPPQTSTLPNPTTSSTRPMPP